MSVGGFLLFLMLIGLLSLPIIAAWLWLCRDNEATSLNLTIEPASLSALCLWEGDMAKIGDKFLARIAPTNDAGGPAPVFDAEYILLGGSYTVVAAADGLSAVLTAGFPGSGNRLEVAARTKGGSSLLDSEPLPDVEADAEEASRLNLTIEPIPA